jgi:protein gp37
MGQNSSIEGTDHTFNPWWGCTKVSPARQNCYAELWAKRMGHQVWGNRTQRRFFTNNHWNEPLIWNHDARNAKRRRRVFCASMADVFERKRELNSWRERLGTLISATPCLDWLLVAKRPENIEQMVPWGARVAGPRARTMHPDWAASLLHQCQKAEVPFHFKQWGHWVPAELTAESRPQVVTFENERSVSTLRGWSSMPKRLRALWTSTAALRSGSAFVASLFMRFPMRRKNSTWRLASMSPRANQ